MVYKLHLALKYIWFGDTSSTWLRILSMIIYKECVFEQNWWIRCQTILRASHSKQCKITLFLSSLPSSTTFTGPYNINNISEELLSSLICTLLPIMNNQVFHKIIMITCNGFSLRKSKLASVLTSDLQHHPHRRNSPLKHHPFEPLSAEIQCHFICNQNNVTNNLQKWITLLWKRHQYF